MLGVQITLGLLFFTTTLLQCNADDGKSLLVKVVAEYDPPSSFTSETPSYRAASALTLSCEVEGVDDHTGLFYEWTSTCSGNCFTRGGVTESVSTPYLHSYDTGVHTCMVYDVLGCTGNASITVNVVGAGIYVSTDLPNNGLITTSVRNTIPSFRCLSGSSRPNVGNLIGPDGTDTTFSTSDPFFISRGGSYDPGTLLVRSVRALEPEDSGIYTYQTPDENGDTVEFHFGVYPSNNTSAPYCPSFEYTLTEGIHTLSCVSYDSPPTEVIWERNGERIYFNDTSSDVYHPNQVLLNRTTSAYNNTLTINATIEDVIGEYSCTIVNSVGRSDTLSETVRALDISGHETPVIVGLSRSINCSTHLEVTRMEWVVVAVGNAVEVDEDGGQSLVLPLNPTTTGLDGAEFTCKITTVRGKVFSETITVEVRELVHTVDISGSANPLSAGEKYSLTCTVTSYLPPSVWWLGPDNQKVAGTNASTEPVTLGNTTTLVLHFDPIKTSHGGTYTCRSSLSGAVSQESAARHIKVQMTSDDLSVTRSPSSATVYTADPLTLTCITTVDPAVDTARQVTHLWTGSGGVVTSGSGVNVSMVTGSGQEYSSRVTFTSLRSSHSGTYTCSSTVSPVQSSVFVGSSAVQTASTSFSAVLRVTIEITYNSPDSYPTYSPPNYRTASSVSLRCVATAATSRVTYRWTSTCRSGCFAYSSSSQTISEPFLRARDAGVHTCRVTDSAGSSGSNTTTMNIVGAGIYVSHSIGSAVSSSSGLQGPQPANSYAFVDTGSAQYSYYTSYYRTRFQMYCCSNTSYPNAIFTYPNGGTSSNDYGSADVESYSGSDLYAGCYRLSYFGSSSRYSSYYLSSSYTGIYTCQISDSRGQRLNVNIGLYSDGSSLSRTSVRSLSYSSSGRTTITLVCRTRYSPPSTIRWYRDGTLLDINGNTTDMAVTVTSRSHSYSYFDISLNICDSPDAIAGRYKCEAGSRLGYGSAYYTVRGLQVSCSPSGFVIGQTVTCSCSSDMSSSSIRFYREDSNGSRVLASHSRSFSFPVTTDIHGDAYVCAMTSTCGDQERNVTIDVTVPNNWASIVIQNVNSSGQNALHGTDYTLTCTVTAISGMNLAPSVEWVGPDGGVVVSGGNITVGEVETQGTISTLTLSFSPVVSSNGGKYECRAAIFVPWMDSQPPQHTASVDMPVTTQSLFQLKMYPLPHCSTWEVDKALNLEQSIKRDIEKAVRERCDCEFSSTAIYSGEFSCQYTSCKSDGCDLATHATYRAILNGTSDLLTVNQLISHLEDWQEERGTLLYNVFRLRMVDSCSIPVDSFDEEECDDLPL